MKRFIALSVCIIMLSVCMATSLNAADITGEETSRTVTEFLTNSGEKTGVTVTTVQYPKSAGILSNSHYYGKEVTAVEADLSNTNVTMRVMSNYNGSSMLNTVRSTVDNYMKDADGEEILAATNADGFYYIPVGAMPCGTMVIDGEVWATNPYEYVQPGNGNKTHDVSWGGANDYVIGVTKENQPLVGLLRYTTTIENSTTGQKITAGGINRNLGSNGLVIYNQRFLNSPYYETVNSYQVVVSVDSDAFTVNNTVEGTVKEIYKTSDTKSARKASLDGKTVIITAAGSSVSKVNSKFSVGDRITMQTRVADQMGHTDLWENINAAVGGHIIVLQDGKVADTNLFANNDIYAVTIAGYNNEGKLMITTFTADEDCKYGGFTMGDVCNVCLELGYNTCFFLDGGGSTTLVTKNQNGKYELTSHYVDGYSDGIPVERRVGNTLAISWSSTKICEKQGSLSYISVDNSRKIKVDAKDLKQDPDGRLYYPAPDGYCYYVDATAKASDKDSVEIDLSKVSGTQKFAEAGYSGSVIVGNGNPLVKIANMDLSGYSACYITYGCDVQNDLSGVATKSGIHSVVGIKSSQKAYNGSDGQIDLTDDIAHADCIPVKVNWAAGAQTVEIPLTDIDYSGDIYVGLFSQPYMDAYHGYAISKVVFAKGVEYTYSYCPGLSEKFEAPEETTAEETTVEEITTVEESYVTTAEEAVTQADTSDETETYSGTDAETEVASREEVTTAEGKSGGCKSLTAFSLLTSALACAVIFGKKKKGSR